jgi:Domain of unknown function (DUF1905)
MTNWGCEMAETFTATTTLWIWTTEKAPASWHFITISGDVADAIQVTAVMHRLETTGGARKRGWGAIKVRAQIGDSIWDTSMFPAKAAGGWMLPVKAAVRKAQGLLAGDNVTVSVTLL